MSEHGEGPARVGVQQAAAHVVDVVRVAVVGEVHGDDALQGGRAPGRHLERVEAPPALAEHADPAVAPGLGRDPGDDLERVVLLLRQVLVEQQAGGFPAAAHVDPKRHVTVPGEEGVHRLVARGGAVAGAVGDVLEDRGHRMLERVAGQPVAHREPGAVGERNELALDLADLAGKGLDYRCLFRRHRFSSFVASFRGPAPSRTAGAYLMPTPAHGLRVQGRGRVMPAEAPRRRHGPRRSRGVSSARTHLGAQRGMFRARGGEGRHRPGPHTANNILTLWNEDRKRVSPTDRQRTRRQYPGGRSWLPCLVIRDC